VLGSLHRTHLYYVVFDESVFPYATPGVQVDVSTFEDALSLPYDEPVTSTTMRNYDLSYLPTDVPASGSVPIVP
jgi:hypothetical protein